MYGMEPKKSEISMAAPEDPRNPVECNRCGDCCKAFMLPWNAAQLKANYESAYRGDHNFVAPDSDGRIRQKEVDAMMAAWWPSLQPLSFAQVQERLQITDSKHDTSTHGRSEMTKYMENGKWFGCNNLKRDENGVYACGIFEHRPDVCARFRPHFDGGYLTHSRQIEMYTECSYAPALDAQTEKTEAKAMAISSSLGAGLKGLGQ